MDPDSLKNRYQGDTAVNYEDDRRESEKWNNEQAAVKRNLLRIDSRNDVQNVLDVPVGTGRFFDIYREMGVNVLGMDVSDDMIEEARKSVSEGDDIEFTRGDIFQLGEYDIDPDVVVCIRLMNWFEFDDFSAAVESIARTGTEFVIIGVRTYPPEMESHETSSSLETIKSGGTLARRAFQILRNQGPKALVDSTSSFVRRRSGSVPTITIHDGDDVISVFDGCGFAVVDRELVDEGDESSEYHVYLLESR